MSHALAEGSTPDTEKTLPKRGKSLTASMILEEPCMQHKRIPAVDHLGF